jgi:hypothetical protein
MPIAHGAHGFVRQLHFLTPRYSRDSTTRSAHPMMRVALFVDASDVVQVYTMSQSGKGIYLANIIRHHTSYAAHQVRQCHVTALLLPACMQVRAFHLHIYLVVCVCYGRNTRCWRFIRYLSSTFFWRHQHSIPSWVLFTCLFGTCATQRFHHSQRESRRTTNSINCSGAKGTACHL